MEKEKMDLMIIYTIEGDNFEFNLSFKKSEDLQEFMNKITRDKIKIKKVINNYGY